MPAPAAAAAAAAVCVVYSGAALEGLLEDGIARAWSPEEDSEEEGRGSGQSERRDGERLAGRKRRRE